MSYYERIRSEVAALTEGRESYDPTIVCEEVVESLTFDPSFVEQYMRESLPTSVRHVLNNMIAHERTNIFRDKAEKLKGTTAGEIRERAVSDWDRWFEKVGDRRKSLKAMTKADLVEAIDQRTKRFNQEGRTIAFLMSLATNMNTKGTVNDCYSDEDLEAILEEAKRAKPTLGDVRRLRRKAGTTV